MASLYKAYPIEEMLVPATWAQIAPAFHLCDVEYCQQYPSMPIDGSIARDIAHRTRIEGYFQQDPIDWQLPIAAMADLIQHLRHLGIPPVFGFMYDEFWLASVRIENVLAGLLGEGFLALPNFWIWHVDPNTAEQGWHPHRDRGQKSLLPDGMPKAMSIWIPLTDATTQNGCIYVVPADRDPTYNTPEEMTMRYQLYDIRALPARAGSLMGWNQALLHWGSRSSPRGGHPRISMGIEFQRGDIEPFDVPILQRGCIPDFNERLQLIALQFERYAPHHRHDLALAEFVSIFSRKVSDLSQGAEPATPAGVFTL